MPTQNTPQKFENFPLTPQKYHRDQRMPTDLTPQKRLLSHPSEKLIRRRGVDIKWNGPKAIIELANVPKCIPTVALLCLINARQFHSPSCKPLMNFS